MSHDVQLQDLLSAVTDAMLADPAQDVQAIINGYAVPRAEVDSLMGIIYRLHLTLVGAQPSRRFVQRLKRELLGAPGPRGVVARIRYLPPRVQIAAGIALIAGFMLLTRRRMLDETRHESHQEAPAVVQ
jgi:hypothetical protein